MIRLILIRVKRVPLSDLSIIFSGHVRRSFKRILFNAFDFIGWDTKNLLLTDGSTDGDGWLLTDGGLGNGCKMLDGELVSETPPFLGLSGPNRTFPLTHSSVLLI